jgi:hypothetical protein
MPKLKEIIVAGPRDMFTDELILAGPSSMNAYLAAPTTSYKVTATYQGGYRAMTRAVFSGVDAAGRARRAGEALISRTSRLLQEDGLGPLTETSVEVIGADYTFGPGRRDDSATGAVLKIGVRHPEKTALEIFAGEFAPFGLIAQGMTGVFAGRLRVAPVFRVYHLLADKASTPVSIRLGDGVTPGEVAPGVCGAANSTPHLSDALVNGGEPSATVTVPLRRLAYGRSGDKGDKANIGLMARRPEFAPPIRDQVTAERVAAFFGHYGPKSVRRWELPGLNAVNFLIDGVLGGSGGTSTLRYDPQGTSYAAMLLTLPVDVPSSWDLDEVLSQTEAVA